MKLGSGRITAIVGVLAFGALFGFTPSASAASYSNLCVEYSIGPPSYYCAYVDGNDIEMRSPSSSIHMTNWYYPNTNGAINVIQQVNTEVCMQVNASGGNAAGFPVRPATCVNDQAEQWANYYDGVFTQFRSVWAFHHGYGNMCLDGVPPDTYLVPCSEAGDGNDLLEWVS